MEKDGRGVSKEGTIMLFCCDVGFATLQIGHD
jgi:hypothetical protein